MLGWIAQEVEIYFPKQYQNQMNMDMKILEH